ncbi:Uncharacterized protein TCM_026262 [Theobroma cacao]|uniref:Uncharacterized protein n=1 Tax=Theobroma cacao TaxID=3641 RepID=A0A061F908_THECC|nr:Uncharacterized protein TCM_026262 [Theobroma cacao]
MKIMKDAGWCLLPVCPWLRTFICSSLLPRAFLLLHKSPSVSFSFFFGFAVVLS